MRIKDDSWIINTPIAHRGLHNDTIPENSLAAFLNAIEKGYAIELDVRFTKDGKIVVFHDFTLERMTNQKGRVIEKTYEELQEYNLANSNQKIPLFTDVLKTVNGRTPILIEIKDQPERNDLVEKTIEQLKDYTGLFALQSFNPFYVIKFKKFMPNAIRGILATNVAEGQNFITSYLLRHFFFNIFSKPDFISFNIENLPYPPAKRKNCRLISWTIRNEKDLIKARKYAENIIFENILP
jgi:glycerophosphoryl diester phosphodiesterase